MVTFLSMCSRPLNCKMISATLFVAPIILAGRTALSVETRINLSTPNSNAKSKTFFDPIIALLLGGFMIAVAMQKHGLDKYMALTLVNHIGNNPKYVLFGLMCITAFLSFWITNTASTLIMIPIALSILKLNKIIEIRINPIGST